MTCPACTAATDPQATHPLAALAHQQVPVRTQYASPDLIQAIAYEGRQPGDDPAWATSGALDQEEYGRWCGHCCGLTCLQMILQHRDGTTSDLLPLLRLALKYDCYVEREDGSIFGLVYAPFVDFVGAEFGLTATVHPNLPVEELVSSLTSVRTAQGWTGRMVIASVHREIRRPDQPAPGQGGHLVLVTGHDPDNDTISFHNPSGHTPAARAATLPVTVFESFYAHRGMIVTLTRRSAAASCIKGRMGGILIGRATSHRRRDASSEKATLQRRVRSSSCPPIT